MKMANCFEIPALGMKCIGDLTFQFAGYQINPAHPGWLAGLVTLAVLGIFVFRSPVR